MARKVFVLMIFISATLKTCAEFTLNCCPISNPTPDRLYEAIMKLNLSHHQRDDLRHCDDVKCPKIRKVQNLKENFIQKSPWSSLVERIRNEECRNKILNFIRGLQTSSSWAVEMFDASSKFPSGLITANTYQFGNYDQCINVISEENSIKGKYCLANVEFSPLEKKYPSFYRFNMENEFSLDYDPYKSALEKFKVTKDFTKKRRNNFHFGVCVPDSCRSEDAEIILNHLALPTASEFGYHMTVKVPDNSCSTGEVQSLSKEGKLLGLLIVAIILFVIVGTVRDSVANGKEKASSKLSLYLEACSLSRNVSTFSIQNGDGDMNVFNGMKTLSMILIIMGHRCMASCGGPFFNPQFLEERYRKFQNVLLLNGILIVDTFFLIGGCLTFLTLFNEYKKNKKLNCWQIYMYRWLRITPVYMLMILSYGHILEHIGTGPIWSMKIRREAERCRKNWWTNFLFINNYVNADSLCMFQSWYVTCDMHFILLAPIIVKLIASSPRKGLMLFVTCITGSILTIFMITYFNKYDGVLRLYITTFEDLAASFTFNRVYIKTHNRATPYFLGMAAGYVFVKLKQAHYKFSLWQVWMFSAVGTVFALTAISGAWLFYIPGREYDALENALYASLHRLFWAIAMSWVALAAGTKSFGIIEPILSQKLYIPFSKLSYTAFLIHGVIQMYISATLRIPEHMSFPKLYWMTCGDVILTFSSAFLLHIFFEAPVKGIQRVLFFRKASDK